VTALVVVAAAAVLAAGGAAAAAIARMRRQYVRSNDVVPGVATGAPAAWAGAHSPEARLHRRLRDAVAAVRAAPPGDGVGVLDARTIFEQQALGVDQRLVAVAALPDGVRAGHVGEVASAVEAIESAAAALVAATGEGLDAAALQRVVAEVVERTALLAKARAELDLPGAST
jgi:hypothetical protein